MENITIYDAARKVPQEACRTIKGGRLNGFTDINPMWRIKRLTELFGACGIGWYYEVTEKRLENGMDGEVAAFVDIALYIKVDGEWSKPIHGTGGSSFIAKEKAGFRMSDEAFKMATTDAISVACKNLGMGADIYWSSDKTKYTNPAAEAKKEEAPAEDQDALEEAKYKTLVFSYLNRHNYTEEQMTKIANLLGKKSIKEFDINDCKRYIALVEKKGGNIYE